MVSLTYFQADINRFEGYISPIFSGLSNLVLLEVSQNQLSGFAPSQLTATTRLNAHTNRISGSLPHELFRLTSLEFVALGGNRISCTIPPHLHDSMIWTIDISHNPLSGSLTSDFSATSTVHVLQMMGCKLSGTIPNSLSQCKELNSIYLQQNYFSGSISSDLAFQLTTISLHQNRISCTIPREISSTSSLRVLHWAENMISGTVPTAISTLTRLESLGMYNTMLSGTIASEFAAFTALKELFAGSCVLSGTIPSSIAAWVHLMYLHLDQNRLSGSSSPKFSQWALKLFSVSRNSNLVLLTHHLTLEYVWCRTGICR